MTVRALHVCLAIGLLAAGAASARGATVYVANNGVDGAACGSKESPCRSISAAINLPTTVAKDQIVAGPGRYGDLDGDGVLGETGEETPAPGCGCVLAINKPVDVTSSDGAAVTVIDGRTVTTNTNVLVITDGGSFGKPRKGFTVTRTAASHGAGIVIDSQNVSVRGNQVIATAPATPDPAGTFEGTGIATVDFDETILIEGNQVVGWLIGIHTQGASNTVRRNAVSLNNQGIHASEGSFTGNVAVANLFGHFIDGPAQVVGNAAHGNGSGGFVIALGPPPDQTFQGTFRKNNVFGNDFPGGFGCGLGAGSSIVDATDNFWGAATGPGPDPADNACGTAVTATPFSAKPFNVKANVKP